MKRQSLFFFGWLLLATPTGVQAQFNYTVTNQTVTITRYKGNNGVVAIPSTIDGLPVTSIGDWAVQGSSITGVTIPNSVTNIGNFAFGYCFSLTNIMVDPLNSAFASVDGVLFNHSQTTLLQCPEGKIGGFTIPSSVMSIGDFAFWECTSLTSVIIPDSVTTIGDNAFFDCTSLTSVTIPGSVTSIGDLAFPGCTSLTNVTIGNSVTNIGVQAFDGCTSLTDIIVDPLNPAFIGVDGVLFNHNQTTLLRYPGGKNGGYTIPKSITYLGAFAFQACTSLTSVTIPNSVVSMGEGAFDYCTSLTNVTIPNSVVSIGEGAFEYCTSLTNVTIPNSVVSIGNYAFGNCTFLRLYFQGNAPSASGSAFWGDSSAAAYYLPGTTGWEPTLGGEFGIQTSLWSLPYPLILTDSLGVQTNGFGFTVSWATNLSVVVEASTDLRGDSWTSIQTNALNNGVVNFTDPQWTKYPSRFYRVRSQ